MALLKRLGLRLLFVGEKNQKHTEGLGEFLRVPATGPEIVAMIKRMLAVETVSSAFSLLAGAAAPR
jgi:hypothetical protein